MPLWDDPEIKPALWASPPQMASRRRQKEPALFEFSVSRCGPQNCGRSQGVCGRVMAGCGSHFPATLKYTPRGHLLQRPSRFLNLIIGPLQDSDAKWTSPKWWDQVINGRLALGIVGSSTEI